VRVLPGTLSVSMVKRGLVTFCNSKQWTKQAAARRPGNRQFCLLSARRAHTNAPYKSDLLWETLRVLRRPERARTGERDREDELLVGVALQPGAGRGLSQGVQEFRDSGKDGR
jgi:hypothetical protein